MFLSPCNFVFHFISASYYGSGVNSATSSCSGSCTLGYYCLAGSTSPTQNACPAGTYGSTPSGTSGNFIHTHTRSYTRTYIHKHIHSVHWPLPRRLILSCRHCQSDCLPWYVWFVCMCVRMCFCVSHILASQLAHTERHCLCPPRRARVSAAPATGDRRDKQPRHAVARYVYMRMCVFVCMCVCVCGNVCMCSYPILQCTANYWCPAGSTSATQNAWCVCCVCVCARVSMCL